MEITSGNPAGRGDRLSHATPWLAGIAALSAVVAGLGWLAQHNERVYYARTIAESPGLVETYSLAGHVLAMALLAVFAVIVASTLISQGSRALAAAVLAASAFGPMTVVGAPLDESKYGEVAGANASFPLHLGVAVGLLALLAGWTVWVVRRSGTASRTQRPRSERRHDALMFGVLFALGNTVGVLLRPDTDETPSYLTVVCWTAMAAAAATALWHSRGMRSALITVLPALTLGAMYVAYFRPGGWAGVAGWELWTSPILFGIPSVAMSLSAPVAVWVARGVRAAMANGRSSALAPATS